MLSDSFMPVGFPHSVSDDYLAYQTYDSLQAFFSTITALLANRALLVGLGVGDANSSATFAMLLTIFKDGLSRVATIVFANRFGLRIEPDAKRYRFLADVLNDTAFFLELYSPFLGPLAKTLALSVGEALRALCGVAAGASKAALSVHFAKHDNLAELNTKEASQETAVGLVGLLVGSVVVKYVEEPWTVVYLMTFLVFTHLLVNYLGVCSVVMDTLNRQRATIVFDEYFKTGNVLSPREAAKRENILFYSNVLRNPHGRAVARLSFATSYKQVFMVDSAKMLSVDGDRFSLLVVPKSGTTAISIVLYEGAHAEDIILAWYTGMVAVYDMDSGGGNARATLPADVLRKVAAKKEELFRGMERVGWDLTRAQDFETSAPMRVRFHAASKKDE